MLSVARSMSSWLKHQKASVPITWRGDPQGRRSTGIKAFAAGVSPRPIAKTLNANVAGPAGSLWNDSAIRGHVKRGTGIINGHPSEQCLGIYRKKVGRLT
jgi:hypothetical protein